MMCECFKTKSFCFTEHGIFSSRSAFLALGTAISRCLYAAKSTQHRYKIKKYFEIGPKQITWANE